ncbi:hypothetical protein FG386_000813 [Cryptosporidium ryanae]|uniref:uncharacterized protein n=1 Tax=Cryptosporidium ryanae TaxID=515981 RepID=UPI00351AA73D|nr:hypothetical protein FG386_000813 [Cryptosporidium ryanae]
MLLNNGITNRFSCLTQGIIHSGLILLSISLEIRGIKGYSTLKCAPNLYLLIPRIGYLICVFDSVRDYYNSFDYRFSILIDNNSNWLEYDGFIINSECPIGLLSDIYNINGLNFCIKLVICSEGRDGKKTIKSISNGDCFFKKITNNIKLSQTLILGNCRKFQMLSEKEYKNLIGFIYSLSLTTEKYECIYKEIFGKVEEIYENARNIPVKIYIKNKAFLKSFSRNINNRPFKIKDILNELSSNINESYDNLSVIFHGIEIPIETPLICLLTSCPYIDGIIHLVLRI